MKNIQIRKCRKVTVYETSEVVDLDPEKFRNLEKPYAGNSDKEFIEYIKDLDLYDIDYNLDIDQAEELSKLGENIEWQTYYSSLEKYEESWIESGKKDSSFRKTGGFDIEHSTEE